MRIAVRAQYPGNRQDWQDWVDKLYPIRDLEVAFHRPYEFLQTRPQDVIPPLDSVDVPTIHMAHASLKDVGLFMSVLTATLTIAKAVACHDIVVHPGFGAVKDLDMIVDRAIVPLLDEHRCNILWETFSSKRRTLAAWDPLAAFCKQHERNYICYDICHMRRHSAEEVIDDIERYGPLIRSYHLSNWSPVAGQHLPIDKGVLDFTRIAKYLRKRRFEGTVTLEYLKKYHDQLVPDALALMGHK